MKKTPCLIVANLLFAIIAQAQFGRLSPSDSLRRDSINRMTQNDHAQMLKQLNIQSLRIGADGNNPNAPNAANYDETKANPFPILPDPLVLKNGQKITDAADWWNKRRPEIEEDFDREIYGRLPKNIPGVKWELIKDTIEMNGTVQVHTRKLTGRVDNNAYPSISVNIDLSLSTPTGATKAVPVVMELSFVFPPGFRFPTPARDSSKPEPLTWQQQCLEKRMGLCSIDTR